MSKLLQKIERKLKAQQQAQQQMMPESPPDNSDLLESIADQLRTLITLQNEMLQRIEVAPEDNPDLNGWKITPHRDSADQILNYELTPAGENSKLKGLTVTPHRDGADQVLYYEYTENPS